MLEETTWGSEGVKEIRDDALVVTGSMGSRKGRDVRRSPRVALTVPEGWGGLLVRPWRVELFEFRTDRVHVRRLYTRSAEGRERTLLQP